MAPRSWLFLSLALLAAARVAAEEPAAKDLTAAVDALSKRLEALERRNVELTNRNRTLAGKVEELSRRLDDGEAKAIDPAVAPASAAALQEALEAETGVADLPGMEGPAPTPFPDPDGGANGELDAETGVADLPEAGGGGGDSLGKFLVGDYDDELGQYVLVRPRDTQRTPFELRFDLMTQVRFQNFAPSRRGWVGATGMNEPIKSFGTVEVPRNFINFYGFAFDPKLQFTAMVFSTTPFAFTGYSGWINYRFNRAVDLRVGVWKIPSTREWTDSFRWTLGADRTMATTFFRADFGPGVWLQGEPIDGLNYIAMIADSLGRFGETLGPLVGTSASFGGTVWYEPTDDYGGGVSDVEYHEDRSFRLGASVNVSHQPNVALTPATLSNLEITDVRLSDGTALFQPNLLGPNTRVASTNLQLWALDASMKHRGFGIYGEYFFRWLNDVKTVGAPWPFGRPFATGGLLEAGYFLKRRKLEAFGRTSFVTGRFGGGVEYGGGLNWYPRGTRTWRTTAEVLRILHSPAQNLLTGYRAGETGTLFQLQWLTDF